MNDELFDDFIKDKFRDQTAAVPADMWDRILSERKKDRKTFFWWQSLGVMALLGCMAGFFGWFGPLDNSKTANHTFQTTINTHPPVAASDNRATQQSDAEKQPLASSSQQHDNDILGSASTTSAKEEKAISILPILSPSANNMVTESSTASGKMVDDNHHSASHSVQNSKHPSTTDVLLIGANNQSLPADENETFVRPQYDRLSLMAAMRKSPIESDIKNLTLSNSLKAMAFSSVDCPSDRRSGNHGFYAEFFASPDIAFKKMEYKNTAANNYASRKDSTATKQLSYTVGMRLVKEIGESMVLKTGIQYSQINERFDYRNENERTTSTVVTIRTITNSNGTTTTIRDTSIVEQVGYRVKTTYNRYRNWDIPVILGYEFAGEGWKANINGGAVFNLSSSQEGAFLDTSYTPSSFTKSGPAIFKSKLGVALYGGLSFIKDISPSAALFAEPYLKYSLSDRTTDRSPFTSRFNTAGVLLGIRFKLNAARAAK